MPAPRWSRGRVAGQEHLPAPGTVIALISSLLRWGGVALISAPFHLVSARFPTHLVTNGQYAGSLELYRDHGLHVIDGRCTWDPLVFLRCDEQSPWRNSIATGLGVQIVGKLLNAVAKCIY